MFESDDCSGTCYAVASKQVFEDFGGNLVIPVNEASVNRAIESMNTGNSYCTDTDLANRDVVSVTGYSVPGITFPFAAPHVVE